jgi:UDP-N-acetylglucosamine pyrophosphorylase
MNHKPHKYSPRHLTQRCSPFSIFLRVIFPSAQRAKICESLFVLTAFVLTLEYSDWDRIKSPAADQIVPYDSLPKPADHKNLGKLAVLKVNGGLGTSMGG